MSVLESIITWAERDLPAWQSDTVRRLLTQDKLTAEDKAELLGMLKTNHGLVDPQIPASDPHSLKKGDISGAPQVTEKITLKAMKGLSNVNAIPDGSNLSFGHEGLTVIYGENATGKSGYARVLKRACSARDTQERILPNIYEKKTFAPARATFKISRNGKSDEELEWEDGQKGPEVLTNIAVFDSKCARVIVNGNNKITYLPYGSDVFPRFVELLKEFHVELDHEKPKPRQLQFDDIPRGTEAVKFIERLSYATSSARIEELTQWTQQDREKLANLGKNLLRVEADDTVKLSQTIRYRKTRLTQLATIITRLDSALSQKKTRSLEKLIKNLNAVEKALVIVSQESLANEPLPGAGGSAWQTLYEAAKQYSTQEAYPGKEFPQTGEGSRCVFCMQVLLEEGKIRLKRFQEFMEKIAKKNVDTAAAALKDALDELEKLDFSAFEQYKDLLEEIRDRNETAAAKIEEYIPAMQSRAEDMIKAGRNKRFESISPNKSSPVEDIRKIAQELEEEAKQIEKVGDPKELAKLKSERDSLQGRRLLAKRKAKIATHVDQLKIAQKYDACIEGTKHTGITNKGREIISGALTPELIKALQDELKTLGAQHLKPSLKASGGYGETSHKMELPANQPLQGIKLTEILSEGEQHVVGIAGFLAELKVSGHEGPIVLDDPVCSLDHRYREKVAERLAKEAAIRQVIVFTHDIAFLLELNSKAVEFDNVKFVAQTVRYDDAPGKCIEGLPWHSMPVKKRLSHLNEKLNNIRGLYSSNLQKYNRRAGQLYGLLRETWEAAVEEVLFHNTIRRYGSEVHTLNLRYVKVKDEDYKKIFLGMKKCSKWLFGHDKVKTVDVNRPAPGEVQSDINTLLTFIKDVHARSKVLEYRRKAFLEPETPEIG